MLQDYGGDRKLDVFDRRRAAIDNGGASKEGPVTPSTLLEYAAYKTVDDGHRVLELFTRLM